MKIFGLVLLLALIALTVWFMIGVPTATAPTDETSTTTDSEVVEEDTSDNDATDEDVDSELDPAIADHIAEHSDIIRLENPEPNRTISSPLEISGEARGTWFFEASFTILLTDWDGLIIAEHYATAEDEWMTEDFVPFASTLEFESPYQEGDPDFMKRGTLILQKANPSGLPENADALEIPVYFE